MNEQIDDVEMHNSHGEQTGRKNCREWEEMFVQTHTVMEQPTQLDTLVTWQLQPEEQGKGGMEMENVMGGDMDECDHVREEEMAKNVCDFRTMPRMTTSSRKAGVKRLQEGPG